MTRTMGYLGVIRGNGSLWCGDQALGHAPYEMEGFLTPPGEVVGSAEIRMIPGELDCAFSRRDLELTTGDGRALDPCFFGNRENDQGSQAHADVRGDLPGSSQWSRR